MTIYSVVLEYRFDTPGEISPEQREEIERKHEDYLDKIEGAYMKGVWVEDVD